MTVDEFIIVYPEFKAVNPGHIAATMVNAALLLGDEARYGDLWDIALAAQTAELLTRSPMGQPARALAPGAPEPPRTQYWRTLRDIKARLPYRMLVTSG